MRGQSLVGDAVSHAALPAGSIVIATLGGWLLSMRNTMITVLGSDYVNLARAKGLHPRRVVMRYAARNALLPSITGFGMALGFVLGGSLLTEVVFSYPGQGYLLVQAVRSQDYALMQGIFLVITLASIGLPLTNGFIGEFLVLIGAWKWNTTLAAFAATGVILSAVYMLWMFQRVNYGPIRNEKNAALPDLSPREWAKWTSCRTTGRRSAPPAWSRACGSRPGTRAPGWRSARSPGA